MRTSSPTAGRPSRAAAEARSQTSATLPLESTSNPISPGPSGGERSHPAGPVRAATASLPAPCHGDLGLGAGPDPGPFEAAEPVSSWTFPKRSIQLTRAMRVPATAGGRPRSGPERTRDRPGRSPARAPRDLRPAPGGRQPVRTGRARRTSSPPGTAGHPRRRAPAGSI